MKFVNILTIILVIVSFLNIISFASALGVAPARIDINFEPNKEEVFDLKIINNERKNRTVSIGQNSASRNIANLTENPLVKFEGQYEKNIELKLQLPETLPSGNHEVKILVSEKNQGKETVNAFLTVVSKINIFVPYPGKYLLLDLARTDFTPGKESNFVINVENKGSEMAKASIDLEIVDSVTNRLQKILNSNTEEILPGKEKLFKIPWNPNVKPGIYKARAFTDYDGEYKESTQTFHIGEQKLLVSNVITDKIENRVEVKVEFYNEWNEELENIIVEIELKDENNILDRSPTPILSLTGYQHKSTAGYLDTTNIPHGSYDLNIKVQHSGKTEDHTYTAILTEENLIIQQEFAIKQATELNTTTYLWITILTVLLAIIIFYFSTKRVK